MARARLLKPGFFQNEILAELPYAGRLLFQGLWTLADREGRLEDRPKRIKAAVFPFDDVVIDDLLAGLAERDFIVRYQAEAVAVIQITTFTEHQKPHKNEPPSKLPSKCGTSANGRSARAEAEALTGDGDGSRDSSEPPAAASELAFPCVGKQQAWELASQQIDEWQRLFPPIDVQAECAKALAWLLANPGRRKTHSGMPRFLVSWLTRSVDSRNGGDRRAVLGPASYQPAKHGEYDTWPEVCRQRHGGECGNYQAHCFRLERERQKAS